MFVYVTRVRVIPPFSLDLEFSNGIRRQVDLGSRLDRPMYLPLRNPAYFAQAYLDEDTLTVAWPNGADFSPDYLLNRAPLHEAEPFRLATETRYYRVQAVAIRIETGPRSSTVGETRPTLLKAPRNNQDTTPNYITGVPDVLQYYSGDYKLSA